ncbi:MAG: hypothetical protein FJZ85_05745 [Chloroflexi bacterium]|nr:hypothetical protein [Chloroflexota bacterium]
MKAKTLAASVILIVGVLSLSSLPVAAVGTISLSPSEGVVAMVVTIPTPCSYGTGDYYIYWGDPPQLISQGRIDDKCTAITFVVPESQRGKHKVTLKVADATYERDFLVRPSLTLNVDKGPVGSSVTVRATGFSANESGIKVLYDGSHLESVIMASSKGSWQATIKVPASKRGSHKIDAEGTTPAAEVPDLTFTVTPEISINPAAGWVGTLATVAGTGFDSAETGITVVYDGLPVKTGIVADLKGSWQNSFSIPTSSTGIHGVDAYGDVTPAADVAEVMFRVSPGMKVEMTSGHLGGAIHVGDKLWVSGVGFGANEAGIQLTFDGTLVASGIISDAKGSWSTQLEVPPCTRGEHIIDATGDLTKTADIADAIVVISPSMRITPTTGSVGDEVVVNGTAFSANPLVTINYAGTQVASGAATDEKGSFTASFRVPKGKGGDHTITATDSAASVASATFSLEKIPPPMPQLLLPESGASIGLWGNVKVPFDWSAVEDPSGVAYTLEISQTSDFSTVILRKDNLEQTEYTLSEQEALGRGKYYWRVRAVDGAGNESNWTSGQFLQVGTLDMWKVALGGAVVIVIIAIVWRSISMRRRGNWK